jgi:hypothetical protein
LPQTRIHNNDVRKNPKKQRQIGRKDLKNAQMDRGTGLIDFKNIKIKEHWWVLLKIGVSI